MMTKNLIAVMSALLISPAAFAVMVPDDSLTVPGHNTTSPPFSLGEYAGDFGSFLGTPIAPRYFVTATHVTGSGPATFVFNNGTSTPTTYNVVLVGTSDDLAIWKIADSDPDSFSLYAPIYTNQNEVGNSMIALGRGTLRGDVVYNSNNQAVGWQWGAPSNDISWGSNVINQTVTLSDPGMGGSFLAFAFDNNGNPEEAALSGGDSGGPVFVQDPSDGVYKLAGVNSSVDGSFSLDASGPYFNAALFDIRGFYEGDATNNQYIDPTMYDSAVPSNSYATRISTRLDFISSVTGITVPEPATLSLLMLLPIMATRRQRKS